MGTIPGAVPGLRVGLLGGSFDPPHEGHVHVTLWAMRAFRLQRVWWLVAPRNPLKQRGPAGLGRRVTAARALLAGRPGILVSDLESRLGTRTTAQTLDALLPRRTGLRFVWLMGSDNLAGLHRWNRWESVIERVPLGVLARPGEQIAAGLSVAARRYAQARLPAREAASLADRSAPAWCLVTGRMAPYSSTALRARGLWQADEA